MPETEETMTRRPRRTTTRLSRRRWRLPRSGVSRRWWNRPSDLTSTPIRSSSGKIKSSRGRRNAGFSHQRAACARDSGHLLNVGINRRDRRQHGGSRCDEASHRCRQTIDPFARPQRLIDESRRARQADTEYDCEATDRGQVPMAAP